MNSTARSSAFDATRTANTRHPFSVTAEVRDDIVAVALCGELDIDALPDLHRVLEELPAHTALEFDCTKLTFLDAAGLGTLIEHARGQNPAPRLRNANTAVRRLLQLTDAGQLFSFSDSAPAEGSR